MNSNMLKDSSSSLMTQVVCRLSTLTLSQTVSLQFTTQCKMLNLAKEQGSQALDNVLMNLDNARSHFLVPYHQVQTM